MAAFVYRDGDNVPPDVTSVVVHPSVRVLPSKAFRGRRRLKEVRLHDGLEEIGDRAFHSCVSLRRLDCPSTVVRIGIRAFWRCERLEELRLKEGVEEIGDEAFRGCDSLRRLTCPSTVVRIGVRTFGGCWELSVAELAGIIVKVEHDAFSGCHSLESIGIPSRAFVLWRETLGYACRPIANGTIARTGADSVLIAPGCLSLLPESNLTELGKSIGVVVNDGEGTEEDRLVGVRREVRKEVRGEVSTILGLAFWRANIDRAERTRTGAANAHRDDAGGGRKGAEGDAVWTTEAREECRGAGKGKEIAQNVLPFLDDLP